MCLALPGRILTREGVEAIVVVGGVRARTRRCVTQPALTRQAMRTLSPAERGETG
mgnify:CR=1 FL=1